MQHYGCDGCVYLYGILNFVVLLMRFVYEEGYYNEVLSVTMASVKQDERY